MDLENDYLHDSIDDTMQRKNDLIAEAYGSMDELNLEIGNPGNAAVDYVNNELSDLELFDPSAEPQAPIEVPEGTTEPGDAADATNALALGAEPVYEGTEEEVEKIPNKAIFMEQPNAATGIEKYSSLLRQTKSDRQNISDGSMTSFAIQRLLADIQDTEALASNALRKSDDARNNIFGKI